MEKVTHVRISSELEDKLERDRSKMETTIGVAVTKSAVIRSILEQHYARSARKGKRGRAPAQASG